MVFGQSNSPRTTNYVTFSIFTIVACSFNYNAWFQKYTLVMPIFTPINQLKGKLAEVNKNSHLRSRVESRREWYTKENSIKIFGF